MIHKWHCTDLDRTLTICRGISRLLLPKRTSPRKRLTLTDSPPAADANAKAVLEVMGTPSPDKGKRGSPVSKKVHLQFLLS